MHPATRGVSEHMCNFGLAVFTRGIRNVTFAEIGEPFANAAGVVQIAHGTEIIIKARIAEEHPLLIFETLPTKGKSAGKKLSILDLFEYGRSIQFSDLPERLWAATGELIGDLEAFKNFGKLRNQIQHFAVPNVDLTEEALTFAFEIVEPLIQAFWEVNVWHCMDPGGKDDDLYVLDALVQRGIRTGNPDDELVERQKEL
jgi:hypothetical protein